MGTGRAVQIKQHNENKENQSGIPPYIASLSIPRNAKSNSDSKGNDESEYQEFSANHRKTSLAVLSVLFYYK